MPKKITESLRQVFLFPHPCTHSGHETKVPVFFLSGILQFSSHFLLFWFCQLQCVFIFILFIYFFFFLAYTLKIEETLRVTQLAKTEFHEGGAELSKTQQKIVQLFVGHEKEKSVLKG